MSEYKALSHGPVTDAVVYGLDESVKLFEEAKELVAICQKHFMLAKGKLSVIRDGFEDVLKEFD